MDLTIFLKSQEKTDINTKSNQNAYEMYQLVNLQNLIDEENWKKCWIMSVAMQRQKLMGVAFTHTTPLLHPLPSPCKSEDKPKKYHGNWI